MSGVTKQTFGANWVRAGLLVGGLVLAVAAACEAATSSAPAVSLADLCESALPDDIRHVLATKFTGWVIQSPMTLSPAAKQRWKSEKPTACPGVAKGRFEGESKTSLAVLIVGPNNSDSSAKLLLFTGTSRESSADFQVLENTETGAGDLFIHAASVHQFFDKKAVERFQARAPDAVLLFDAGKDEYETDIYFWSNYSRLLPPAFLADRLTM